MKFGTAFRFQLKNVQVSVIHSVKKRGLRRTEQWKKRTGEKKEAANAASGECYEAETSSGSVVASGGVAAAGCSSTVLWFLAPIF